MIGSLTLTLVAPSLRDWGLAEALGQESRERSCLLLHRSLTLKKSVPRQPGCLAGYNVLSTQKR